MARRIAIPHDKMALRIVGPYDEYLAARIQRLDMPTNMPTTNIQELGNPHLAGQTTDIPEVTSTFQAMDVSIKVFATLTGNDPASYPVNGVDITDLGEVDLIGVVKDKSIADYVKSIHIQRAQVTGFTFTYSVDGESTEEYTVSGREKRWFRHDIVVEALSAIASPVSLTYDPSAMKNGEYCLSVILDGDYLTEVTGAPASGEYQYTPGPANQVSFSPLGTRIVVVYHYNTGLNLWSNVSDTTIPAAVRGKNVPVRITASGVTTAIDRVQSVTIRGTFPNTVVKEMGNLSVVGTVVQVPEVTGDISVLDTDLELIALFATGDLSNADVEYRTCEFTASGISLEVQIQEPSEGCSIPAPTVLKAVYIPQLTLTSEGHTTNVGGNATQTFAFKSTNAICVVYSGAYTGILPSGILV